MTLAQFRNMVIAGRKPAMGQKATSVCPTQCPHCRQKLPLDANKDADVLSSNVDTADSDAWKRHRRLSFDKMALPSKP